jgi:hypothetical protein
VPEQANLGGVRFSQRALPGRVRLRGEIFVQIELVNEYRVHAIAMEHPRARTFAIEAPSSRHSNMSRFEKTKI